MPYSLMWKLIHPSMFLNPNISMDNRNEIDSVSFAAGIQSKDIEFVRNQCLTVNDDNEQVPENIPQDQDNFLAPLTCKSGDKMGLIEWQSLFWSIKIWPFNRVAYQPSKLLLKSFEF